MTGRILDIGLAFKDLCRECLGQSHDSILSKRSPSSSENLLNFLVFVPITLSEFLLSCFSASQIFVFSVSEEFTLPVVFPVEVPLLQAFLVKEAVSNIFLLNSSIFVLKALPLGFILLDMRSSIKRGGATLRRLEKGLEEDLEVERGGGLELFFVFFDFTS